MVRKTCACLTGVVRTLEDGTQAWIVEAEQPLPVRCAWRR